MKAFQGTCEGNDESSRINQTPQAVPPGKRGH